IALRGALDEDLIRPDGSSYWEATDGEVPNFGFRFTHDRIQQAAYSLLPDSTRRSTHLKLGRGLLSSLSEADRQHRLFDIAEHLHAAADLISSREDRDQVSRLNFSAGQRALQSAAYSHAHEYLLRAAACAGDDIWDRD